jgi:alcohol dehydrogenase class IV
MPGGTFSLAIKHWLLKKMQDPRTTPLPILVQGKGQLGQLASVCSELGMTHPLIVTDSMLVKIGLIASVTAGLTAAGLMVTVYDKVHPRLRSRPAFL